MKPSLLSASLLSLAHALILSTHAAITIPGADGSDGALNVTQDSVIDSSKATTAKWDDNNSANAGNGVYDPEKWAVVRLVSGNVTVAGTVDLSRESCAAAGFTADPSSQLLGERLAGLGPAGFRAGTPWRGADVRPRDGFGPDGVASGAADDAESGA